MECFFLHCQASTRLFKDYPIIWKAAKADPRGRSTGSGLSRYGSRGLIYEAAGHGGLGTVKEVEQVVLYDFYNYLSFHRVLNDRD